MNFLITDLKLDRFLFSLPWLLVSYFVLAMAYPIQSQGIMFWVAVGGSFFGARCVGMSLNQIIDNEFDKRNVRTATRALASGQLSLVKAYLVTFFSFLLLVIPLFVFEKELVFFAIAPILLIVFYSWTKRWTPFCHFWLGSIYFFLPTALSIALFGSIRPESLWLGIAFALLITAGDLLYSIQDREVDQKEGLKSFPSRFGIDKTVWTARFLILLAISCLISLHLYMSAIALAILWGRFLLSSNVYNGPFANRAFQTCNLYGGLLLLLTFWI